MPQIEWYYAKNDQPCGPVSPVELKQFVQQGELHEEDLVWREGMGEWIPAGKIKGLFEANGDTVAEDALPPIDEPDNDELPLRGEVPARAIPDPPPASAELPVQSTPLILQRKREEIRSEAGKELEDELAPLRHPFDAIADLARVHLTAHFVRSTVVLFRYAGQAGVVLAAIAIVLLAGAVGSRADTVPEAIPLGAAIPLAAGMVIALLIGQYAAGRVFPAMEALDRTARARLSATGPLDSLAWMMTVLGLVSLIGLGAFAMATASLWPAFLGVALFIPCLFTAVVTWNPRAVWLEIGAPGSPGREAAGQVCFFGKLLWRLAGVAYGTGMILGSIATLNVALHIGFTDQPHPGWFTAELLVPLALIAAALPLPVVGYMGFLLCQFLSELLLIRPGNGEARGRGRALR